MSDTIVAALMSGAISAIISAIATYLVGNKKEQLVAAKAEIVDLERALQEKERELAAVRGNLREEQKRRASLKQLLNMLKRKLVGWRVATAASITFTIVVATVFAVDYHRFHQTGPQTPTTVPAGQFLPHQESPLVVSPTKVDAVQSSTNPHTRKRKNSHTTSASTVPKQT
jgi:hypothetical protein